MKKNAFLIIFFCLLPGLAAISQTYRILVQPAGSKTWGYADLTGEMVIPPRYKKCTGFSEEGFAAIYYSNQKEFFFIDASGQRLETEIQNFKLYEVFGFGMKGFCDGFAAVKYREKWGFINTEGKLAIPATFENVTYFSDGYASGLKEGKFYVLDKLGHEIPVDISGVTDINRFSEGFALFKTEAGTVGFIDAGGKQVIPAKFRSAGEFKGGMAWAKDNSEKVGYIDTRGEWLIEPRFEAGKNYDPVTGLARVKTADTWAYTDKQGNLHYLRESELFEDFCDGLARGKKNDLFGYLNSLGEWVIQPQFDGARDFKNGYASVKKGDRWGVIDTSGKWVIEPSFEDIKDVEVIR